MIRSSTRRAIGPICHSASIQPPAGGKWPVRGRRPEVGLMAAHPQKAAGSRTLPAQSLPRPSGEPQAASSAASPPLEPPGVRAGVVRVARGAENQVVALEGEQQIRQIGFGDGDGARAAATAAPASHLPWRRRRSSAPACPPSPRVPANSIESLMLNGTPCSGPRGSLASAAAASASALSASTPTAALIFGLIWAIRSR